jgi:hypothetical protein
MTYGYGEGVPPHRREQHQDESNQSAGADASRHGHDRSQQYPYGSPRPPQHGDGQYGGGPQTESNPPHNYRSQPPGDFRTPGRGFPPPHNDVPQRAGPSRGGGYGAPTQYGGSGQHGVGPGREPRTHEADRYRPRASFDPPRLADPEPEPERRSRKLVIVAIIVVVLAISGGGGWYFLRHNFGDSGHGPSDVAAQKIADQKIDPIPLNDAEVFGSGSIPSSAGGGGSYKVVKTQAASDCKTAVGGQVAPALTAAGCTQVVRATLTSPDGAYVITAGIFNLADATKASTAQTAIKTALDAGKGRFGGLVAGGSTNVIELAAANVAWEVHGHYLAYCLVAKTDGSAIAVDDPRTHQIISDVIEGYLNGTVIRKRETDGGQAEGGSATPSR